MKKPLSFCAHYDLVPGAKMVQMRRFPIMSSGILHKFSNFFCAFCTNFSRNTHRYPQYRSIWLIWLIVLIVFNGAQSIGWARIPRETRPLYDLISCLFDLPLSIKIPDCKPIAIHSIIN